MTVDVVIATRDTRDLTLSTVAAVLADEAVARCVVVDNASTDGTADALPPSVELVRLERPVGFAAACNAGAAVGDAPCVLFLNSDAVPDPGAIGRLAAELGARPGCVAAAGRLVDPGDRRPQAGFAVRGFPTPAGQLAVLTGLERRWPGGPLSRRQRAAAFDYERTQETGEQVAGACLLCRRDAFSAIGGFDEGFPFWFEDVDLVRRLGAHGGIVYVADAVFVHEGGASVRRRPRGELAGPRYTGLVRYFDKHGRPYERAVVRALVVATAALRGPSHLRAALSAVRRRP